MAVSLSHPHNCTSTTAQCHYAAMTLTPTFAYSYPLGDAQSEHSTSHIRNISISLGRKYCHIPSAYDNTHCLSQFL